jgi:hypothetical protein
MTYFEYFNSFDTDIVKQYNSYAQAHYNMFVALEQYVLTKDISEKNKVITNLKIIAQAFSAEKDLKTKYITVINNYFVPNNDLIKKATTGLRTKIEKKLNTLVTTNSITLEEYNTTKSSYNDFILHLTIFFEYDKLEIARIQALTQARIFIPIYNKKIISQESVISIPENTIPKEKEDNIIIETPTITEETNTDEVTQRVY